MAAMGLPAGSMAQPAGGQSSVNNALKATWLTSCTTPHSMLHKVLPRGFVGTGSAK